MEGNTIIKNMMFLDHTDERYDFGLWRAPGEGWTLDEWQELANAVRNLDFLYYESLFPTDDVQEGNVLDELSFVEDGYAAIIQWLAPELERIDIVFSEI